MSILDKLRAQPRWKHSDPEERVAAVRELADDQKDLLASLAKEDPHPHVRREAIGRLDEPGLLAELSRSDADAGVRRAASAVLLEIALRSSDPIIGRGALDGLSDPKHLGKLVTGATLEAVRRGALARLDDAKALGSVACHCPETSIRLEALRRISDDDELIHVATQAEYQDVSLTAVDRLEEVNHLRTIARKAKDAGVRARAADRVAAHQPEPVPVDPEKIRDERVELCRTLELLAESDSWDLLRSRVTEAEEHWSGLEPAPEADLEARFLAACETLRLRLSRHEIDQAEEQRRSEELTESIAARTSLCEALETCPQWDTQQRLEEARAAWALLSPSRHPAVLALNERFERACRASADRQAAWESAQSLRAERETLLARFESIFASADPLSTQADWDTLRSEWRALDTGGKVDPDHKERYAQACARHASRVAEAREERARAQQENLARLRALLEEFDPKARSDELTLREADRGLREINAVLEEHGPLPSKRAGEQILKKLRALRSALGARIHELREIGEWKRWANIGIREELCQRVESLLSETDLDRADRRLKEIDRRWQRAGPTPRDQAELLRKRFETTRDQIRANCDAHLARVAAEQAEHLQRKLQLCERAEGLAESSDWVKTAEEIKALQVEWRAIGPVPPREARAVWRRFRAPCDRFFGRRKEDLEKRRQRSAENLARKRSLIEQAEGLADSTDWEETAAKLKRLQAEWKTTGFVPKRRAEAVWRRFRAACDRFFERYGQRDKIDREARLADSVEMCQSVEDLLPPAGTSAETPAVDVAQKALHTYDRWREIRGPDVDSGDPVSHRFMTAIDRLVRAHPDAFRATPLDLDANRANRERLCAKLENLLPQEPGEAAAGASPATILAERLREALASNTIGGGMAEEARWRAANEELQRAKAAWARIGPAPVSVGEALAKRFASACQKIASKQPPPRGQRHVRGSGRGGRGRR